MSIFIPNKEKKKFFEDLHTKEYSSLLALYSGITPDTAYPLDESIFYDSLFQRGQQTLYFQAEYPQTSSVTSSCNNPLSIFVAHTYDDGRMVQRMDQILRTIAYQEENIHYQFGEIALDTRWKESRYDYLASVDLILLLVTQAFIATEYCYSQQLKWAILRHKEEKAYIVPVLLQACLWDGTPFARLHTITPANRKAVDQWPKPGLALNAIATDIRNAVRYIRRGR